MGSDCSKLTATDKKKRQKRKNLSVISFDFDFGHVTFHLIFLLLNNNLLKVRMKEL